VFRSWVFVPTCVSLVTFKGNEGNVMRKIGRIISKSQEGERRIRGGRTCT
jgi:hypothetical protein